MKKKTKKKARRLFSTLLMLAMCINMSLTAFATDGVDIETNVSSSTSVLDEAPEDNEGETPEDNEGETPEDNEGETPEGNEGETPEGNEGEEPEGNEGETPEGNEGETPEGNEGETPEGNEGETPKDTEGDGEFEEKEIPTVIQEFLDAVEEVLNFGEVTEENAEDYHALYEAAMDAYEKVKSEGLEEDERVVEAMEKLEEKGDVQSKEEEIPTVIQEFLDAVDAVLNFGEVTEENAEDYYALYEAAMDAYEKVKSEGLEEDERVVEAMEMLEAIGNEQLEMAKRYMIKSLYVENSDTFRIHNEDEFVTAINTINSSAEGSEYTIILEEDVTLANQEDLHIMSGHTVHLKGNGHSITNGADNGRNFLGVNGGVLYLGGNGDTLTIQGNANESAVNALMACRNNGAVHMYDGVTLQNNVCNGADGTGAVTINSGGSFYMHGGLISNCKVLNQPFASGVLINNGSFYMSGGVIEKCEGRVYGGGVCVTDGNFDMSGGIIQNCNTSLDGAGGGVFVFPNCTFNMSGSAEITGCTADCGGGIYAYSNSTVSIAGKICNNTAISAGDDIMAANSSNLTLSSVGSDWILNSTGESITNWYYDGYRVTDDEVDESRWNVSDVEEECYLYEYEQPTNGVIVALKAAHGVAVKQVTVTYKDAEGNVIGEPETQVKGSEFTVKDALESTTDKEFDYWYGDDGNKYQPGDKVVPESNLVLTAVMKDKEKTNPVNPNPEKPDPEKPDPEKPDPEKPNSVKPDKSEPNKVESNQVNPNQAQTDLVKVNPVNPNNASENVAKADIPRMGDSFNQMLLVVALLSCCSLAAMIFFIKKGKKWQQEL